MNSKLELLRGVNRLMRLQVTEFRARLVGLRESAVIAAPATSGAIRHAHYGRVAGRTMDLCAIDKIILPALDQIDAMIPAMDEIGNAGLDRMSRVHRTVESGGDNVYRVTFDRSGTRDDAVLSGSLLRAIDVFADQLPARAIELRQLARALADTAAMLQQTYRDFLFSQTIG